MEADCETSTLLKEINEKDFSPHTENSHLNYFMSWLLQKLADSILDILLDENGQDVFI